MDAMKWVIEGYILLILLTCPGSSCYFYPPLLLLLSIDPFISLQLVTFQA